jgi:adenylylsulfate kinase-like enzyme
MSHAEQQPVALLLLGIGGTGKSTLASHLMRLLNDRGYKPVLIRFDEFRKGLAGPGIDPFSTDPAVKTEIYRRAVPEFLKFMYAGRSLVIDSGLSLERIRCELKQSIPQMRICHIHCPILVAIMRDSMRSFFAHDHERGRWLHLRALRDRLNPFKKDKFPQPGITSPFEFPESADLHVNTFFQTPEATAAEIIKKLGL